MYFQQEHYRSHDVVSSVSPCTREHMVLTCLITDEITFHRLVKMKSARFFHGKITVFAFVINKYTVGKYLGYANILFLIIYC